MPSSLLKGNAPCRKKKKDSFSLATFIILLAVCIPEKNIGQSALGQLETMAHRRVDQTSVPSANSYSINWQQRREYLEQKRQEDAAENYSKGVKAFNQRNWDDAVRFLKKAARKDPNNGNYRSLLQQAVSNLQNEQQQNKELQDRIKRQDEERKRQDEEIQRKESERLEKERREQEAIKQKLVEAEETILSFKKDIKIAQGQLKNYTKALTNNNSELEKWGKTVDDSYNNVLENSKGYLAGMFIKYNLMGGLKRQFQKDVFKKMGNLMNSSNPEIQKWLAREMKAVDVKADRIQDVIDRVSLGGDLAEILASDKEKAGSNLKVLLFLNGVLETSHLSQYETLMKETLGAMPGEYFEQAKMIGETYADLAAICYSWFSIRKLNADNNEMANKVNILSIGVEQRMKEIDCLERCMKKYTDRCLENCTGKTKWSTPPPPLLFEHRKW